MASKTQETLSEAFLAVSRDQARELDTLLETSDQATLEFSRATAQVGELGRSGEGATSAPSDRAAAKIEAIFESTNRATPPLSDVAKQIDELWPSHAAEAKSSSAGTTTQADSGSTAGSIVSTVLKSGFGMVPLIGGLIALFGGGETPAPPPLLKYALPAPLDLEMAETASGLSYSDYDQAGMPRAYGGNVSSGTDSANAPVSAGGRGTEPPGAAPQITVNVQAMDARSFLDHSNEIARAVRDAMLNLNSINDVVNEL